SQPAATQDVDQDEGNCQIAKHKNYFQCKCGLMNRGYNAEEELSAGGIGAREVRGGERTGLRWVEADERRVAGDNKGKVVAEPLHTTVPDIPMNVIIGTRWHP